MNGSSFSANPMIVNSPVSIQNLKYFFNCKYGFFIGHIPKWIPEGLKDVVKHYPSDSKCKNVSPDLACKNLRTKFHTLLVHPQLPDPGLQGFGCSFSNSLFFLLADLSKGSRVVK